MLIDLKPSGKHYMEHFHWAGGVPRLMHELSGLLDLDARTVEGKTLRDVAAAVDTSEHQDVIRTSANPISASGSMAVLRGNLAPRGAIIKQSAASPALMTHTGRAVVFENVEDMACASIRPSSTSPPTTCWCCATPARSARRACPRPATCRSRRSWRCRASRTWCASPTRA